MIEEILVNALGAIFGEVLGNVLKLPVKQMLSEQKMHSELIAAVKRAEKRFAQEYRVSDPELTDALITQTHFIDMPSVQAALKEMLTHPFHDPTQSVETMRRSFHDVLPETVDRARVDAAVNAFLHSLGQEVLHIPQLEHLYTLAFQKVSAESSRNIDANTAALVESVRYLRDDIQQLPTALASSAFTLLPKPINEPIRPSHNLPQRNYTYFVGRENELRNLKQLMLPHPRSRHFLVTLDGIGGVGKSALALELACYYRDTYNVLPPEERFEAIIWVSAKRSLLTADGIQPRQQMFNTLNDLYYEIATILELTSFSNADRDQQRRLVEYALTGKRTLLIVDNLETVDDQEMHAFLHELPDPTKAIVTTRYRIDIAYAIRLTGMPHADALALIELEATNKKVTLSAASAEDLNRRTGGIPLAIVWSIGLMGLGYGIESVLRRLGSGHSDIARFCFTESMTHIQGRGAYRLLLALAFFETGVNRKILGDVAEFGNDEIGRDDALAELLQLSLINQEESCFTLLPLTRSFVLDELLHHPEIEPLLREQWVNYFIRFAKSSAGWHWLRRDLQQIRQEGVHLSTLAAWCQQMGRPEALLEIFPALGSYYDMMGHWTEIIILGKSVLEYAQLTGNLEGIVFIETHNLSWILSQQGHHEEAKRYLAHALHTAQQMGNTTWQCEVLVITSQALRRCHAFEQALEYCQQALQLVPSTNTQQRYVQATIEYELGKYYRDLENWQEAQSHFYAAREVFREDEQDPTFNMELAWGILSNLGFIEHQLGNLAAAEQMYLKSLGFFRELGSRANIATILVRLAMLEEQRGNYAMALRYADEASSRNQRLGMVQEQEQLAVLYSRLK